MDVEEKVLAIVPFVSLSPTRLVARLAYYWKRPFAPRYGHLILTNRRLAHIRVAKSRKITEVRRELMFSGTIAWKGLESYSIQDLSADVTDGANLEIRLEDLATIRATGRNDSALELEMATARGRGETHLRFFLLSGLYEDNLGGGVPVAAGGSMATFAEAIRRTKTGQG